MKILLGAFMAFCLMSCGEDYCALKDFEIAGICVIENENAVDPAMVEAAVYAVENAFSRRGLHMDLPWELSAISAAAEFTTNKNHEYLRADEYSSLGYRGRQVNSLMVVLYHEGDCVETYYILAHELLHIVAYYIMNVDNDDSADHSTPYLFYEWADQSGGNPYSTVEGMAHWEVEVSCAEQGY